MKKETRLHLRRFNLHEKKEDIDHNLSLLSVIPDCPHVGKSLKASCSNWFLKLGHERGNLSLLRNLQNRSAPEVSRQVKRLTPKNDFVRNRDCQDPSAVLALTDESLLEFLSDTGSVTATIIPETGKFTADNRPGMHQKPVSITVGHYGWIYICYKYDETIGNSDLLKARMHSPIDTFSVLKKNIPVNEVQFNGGMLFLCGNDSKVSFVDLSMKSHQMLPRSTAKKLLQICCHRMALL